MLSIFEGVAVDPYIHYGFQITAVERQWVSAESMIIGAQWA